MVQRRESNAKDGFNKETPELPSIDDFSRMATGEGNSREKRMQPHNTYYGAELSNSNFAERKCEEKKNGSHGNNIFSNS